MAYYGTMAALLGAFLATICALALGFSLASSVDRDVLARLGALERAAIAAEAAADNAAGGILAVRGAVLGLKLRFDSLRGPKETRDACDVAASLGSWGLEGEWGEVVVDAVDEIERRDRAFRMGTKAGGGSGQALSHSGPLKGLGVVVVPLDREGEGENLTEVLFQGGCAECVLLVQGEEFASDAPVSDADQKLWRGTVQSKLVAFLRKCPTGTVVVENFERFHPTALNPFHTALSESGSFMDMGEEIYAWGAKYFFSYRTPWRPEWNQHTETATREVKDRIVDRLKQQMKSNESAGAFRRRLDFVLPVQRASLQPSDVKHPQ